MLKIFLACSEYVLFKHILVVNGWMISNYETVNGRLGYEYFMPESEVLQTYRWQSFYDISCYFFINKLQD